MKPIIQLIVCENSNSFSGKNVIENPYSLISFPFMPTSASFRLAIVIGRLEHSEVYDLRLTMYKSDKEDELVFDSGTTQMGPFSPPIKEVTRLENLNLEFSINNTIIRTPGNYTFKIQIDDYVKTQEIGIDHIPESSND